MRITKKITKIWLEIWQNSAVKPPKYCGKNAPKNGEKLCPKIAKNLSRNLPKITKMSPKYEQNQQKLVVKLKIAASFQKLNKEMIKNDQKWPKIKLGISFQKSPKNHQKSPKRVKVIRFENHQKITKNPPNQQKLVVKPLLTTKNYQKSPKKRSRQFALKILKIHQKFPKSAEIGYQIAANHQKWPNITKIIKLNQNSPKTFQNQ